MLVQLPVHVLLAGYLISCVSSSVSMALAIGPPVIIPFLLFGGFFLNNRYLPCCDAMRTAMLTVIRRSSDIKVDYPVSWPVSIRRLSPKSIKSFI
jgi:hypothetical protein